MNLIWKLLRHHINVFQLAGFFMANLVGMLIIVVGIQFYTDVKPLFSGKDNLLGDQYLIVTKRISTLGSVTGKNLTFTDDEILGIKEQPFTKKTGSFTPSKYNVTAGINLEKLGVSFATDMFFESVPDEYIDTDTEQWVFDENTGTIPIILPRNYLNLYNFGFAQSRSLPNVSEGMAGMVNLDVYLSGNGTNQRYKGKIVGFSERLNTILVPQRFMDWANQAYAGNEKIAPSRLIIEVTNPTDERITRYFKSQGYETEDGKLDNSQVAWFLKLTISIVLLIGILICGLAFYMLMLSIYLILQKNTEKLENLLLLGFTAKRLAQPYTRLVLSINGAVLLFALAGGMLLRMQYVDILQQWPVFEKGSVWPVFITGILLFILVSVANIVAIRRKINGLGYKQEV